MTIVLKSVNIESIKNIVSIEIKRIYRFKRCEIEWGISDMKVKIIAGSIIMIGLISGCGRIEETLLNESPESKQSLESSSIPVHSSSIETLTPEEEQQIKEKKERQAMLDELPDVSVADWNLILVNNSKLIDPSLKLPLTTLPNGYMIDERIKEDYDKWLEKASEAGFEMVLVSSYRSVDLQQKNYDASIQRYLDQNYTQEEAVSLTEDYIAIPRGSEHHTGLAVDIVDSEWLKTGKGLIPEYDTQDSQKWLLENMEKYGFILRFPRWKEEETGIEYESWHFRYVGVENANYIKKYNLSLEEYIELLKDAGK